MNEEIATLTRAGSSIYTVETLPINAFWHIVLLGLTSACFVTKKLKPAPAS